MQENLKRFNILALKDSLFLYNETVFLYLSKENLQNGKGKNRNFHIFTLHKISNLGFGLFRNILWKMNTVTYLWPGL